MCGWIESDVRVSRRGRAEVSSGMYVSRLLRLLWWSPWCRDCETHWVGWSAQKGRAEKGRAAEQSRAEQSRVEQSRAAGGESILEAQGGQSSAA